jgi:hypothetical protein
MKLVALNALAAACLAALAGPVFADAYSTATFGNVTVTLVDLNPNDGIAPSISFLPYANMYDGGAGVRVKTEMGLPGGYEAGHKYDESEAIGDWQADSVSNSSQLPLATASGYVTGSASGVGFTGLSASGHAESGVDNRGIYHADASAPGFPNSKFFTLSANTMVTFSVNAAVSASMTRGYTAGALEGEAAYAMLTLFTGGLDAQGKYVFDQQDHVASVLYETGSVPGGASDSWSGVMAASFSNLSNQSSKGEFYAEGVVGGRSVISAVPEPSTYGMLLGGLGLMGVLARRRNRAVRRGE